MTVRPSWLLDWTPLLTSYLGCTTAVVVASPFCGCSPSAVKVAVLVAFWPLAVVKLGYLSTTFTVAVVPGASGLTSLILASPPTVPAGGTVDPAMSTVEASGVHPTNSIPGGRASTISPLTHSLVEQVYESV
ncbi:hypothetical protein GCM10020229_80890 [Kitasatospora albolonga]